MEPLLEVRDLCIDFQLRNGPFHAVRNVSFSLMPGQIMGLAGESGSGKTTVGLSVLKLLHENGNIRSGSITFNNMNLLDVKPRQMRDIRWKQISMVFQGAMNAFNPVKKMGDQLIDVLTLRMKMNRKQARAKLSGLLNALGIDESRMNNYPHEFSGGMRQRAMIAMALICDPRLVIADEPTTALDVMTKAQMLQLLHNLRDNFNVSMIVVSHDLSALAEVCDTVAIMNDGELVEFGTVDEIFYYPKHPYTQHLISMIPRIDGENQLFDVTGPKIVDLPKGTDSCVFAHRCTVSEARCFSVKPATITVDGNHAVKCHLYADVTAKDGAQ